MFTLILPGLERRLPDAAGAAPVLLRLLARGSSRALEVSPWQYLAGLAGGDAARWPVGPVSAAAELTEPPPACLRAEPLGADPERHGMFRLPAAHLGVTLGEAQALAAAVEREFGADGLRLRVATPERWYLCWDSSARVGREWRGFEGPAHSLPEGARPAPPEPDLRRLLSELELLFHAQPVNASRRARGMPGIAGLHAWGGGVLSDALRPPATPCQPLTEEPYLAGLKRLGGLAGEGAPGWSGRDAPAGGTAWPLVESAGEATALAEIDADWVAPLAGRLRRGELAGIRIVAGSQVHEVRRLDLLKFWRRARRVAAC